MKNLFLQLFRATIPLVIVLTMFNLFISQTKYATYGNYTYNIKKQGQEMVIVSGLGYIGETITIKNEVINFQDSEFYFKVTSKQGSQFYVTFTMPDGNTFSINQFDTEFVKFSISGSDTIHGGGSTEFKNDRRNLLISIVLVYLRTKQLYNLLGSYDISYLVLIFIEYLFYLFSDFFLIIIQKVLNKRYTINSILWIKGIGLLFLMLTSLLPFLLL